MNFDSQRKKKYNGELKLQKDKKQKRKMGDKKQKC